MLLKQIPQRHLLHLTSQTPIQTSRHRVPINSAHRTPQPRNKLLDQLPRPLLPGDLHDPSLVIVHLLQRLPQPNLQQHQPHAEVIVLGSEPPQLQVLRVRRVIVQRLADVPRAAGCQRGGAVFTAVVEADEERVAERGGGQGPRVSHLGANG